jgi:peptidoglycan/xylan/chitin deacetylase (PgdA/CDA1 family)
MSMAATLRRTLRLLVVGALYYSGVLPLWFWLRRRLARGQVLVLGFHRVLPEEAFRQSCSLDGILLTETTFAEMLAYLKPRFVFLTLEEFLALRAGNGKTSRAACLLTFDDGWKDNYRTAYPCLKKFGVPATIFLVTGMVNSSETFWVERLHEVWRDKIRREEIRGLLASDPAAPRQGELEGVIEYLKHMPAQRRGQILQRVIPARAVAEQKETIDSILTWEQVRAMRNDGVDFGSHTHTHPLLTYESDEAIERELRVARQALEERLGLPARAFAYPNGTWDARVREHVKRTGYECAFTTERGWSRPDEDPYSIRRVLLHEGAVTGFGGRFSPAMLLWTLVVRA